MNLIIATVVTGVITVLGGFWVAQQKPKWLTAQRLSNFVGLGTGLLMALLFSEFIPHSISHENLTSSIMVFIGVMFVIAAEKFLAPRLNFLEGHKCDHDHSADHEHKHHPELEHQHHLISHQAACSAVGCLMICCFFDGIELKAAFSLGTRTGWLTALGLIAHILPDGALAAGIALAGGMKKSAAKKVALITGVSLIAGVAAAFAIAQISLLAQLILPFASGVLIYVCFIHLLPVSLKHPSGFLWLFIGGIFGFVPHALH